MNECQRCPICNGKGIVNNGFYMSPSQQWGSTDASPEKCKSCDGKGVIWN